MAIVPFAGTDTRGLVGMHANSEEWNTLSRRADNVAAAPIGVGQPVVRVSGNDKVVRAWTTGAAYGVTVYQHHIDTATGYKEGDEVVVMTEGVMWVAAGAACVAGTPAAYNPTTDRWGPVASGYVNVPGCEFDSNAASGSLVKIRIQRPAAAPAA